MSFIAYIVFSLCFTISVLSLPIAFHQLVVLNVTHDSVIRLGVYDRLYPTSDFTFYVENLPENGELRQLSQVYSNYGYIPISGYKIQNLHSKVSDSKNRVYYVSDLLGVSSYVSFSYSAVNKKNGDVSGMGLITMVQNNGIISESNFMLNNDGWSIVGNKEKHGKVDISYTSVSSMMSRYIYGNDNIIHSNTKNINDKKLWYFEAPDKFTGNKAIAYGGYIEFNIASFSGDFSRIHTTSYAVILECAICNNTGLSLGIPTTSIFFNGEPTKISFRLVEDAGWLDIDSNRIMSKCEFINILSKLSSIKILGDWTTLHETIALDNVVIKNNITMKLPICYGID